MTKASFNRSLFIGLVTFIVVTLLVGFILFFDSGSIVQSYFGYASWVICVCALALLCVLGFFTYCCEDADQTSEVMPHSRYAILSPTVVFKAEVQDLYDAIRRLFAECYHLERHLASDFPLDDEYGVLHSLHGQVLRWDKGQGAPSVHALDQAWRNVNAMELLFKWMREEMEEQNRSD